jgi:hypothetical protein
MPNTAATGMTASRHIAFSISASVNRRGIPTQRRRVLKHTLRHSGVSRRSGCTRGFFRCG